MTLLLDMMSPGTNVSLSNGDTMTPFHSVATFMNASNNINSAPIPKDTLLQTMKDSLRRQQTGPKVAVLIIDDSYWKTNLNNLIIAKNQVEEANKLGITVIALVVGRQSAGMERVLTTIFGTVNKLSVNSITMDAIVTSGFNQLLNRICTVLSVPDPVTTLPTTTTTTPETTTPPPIDNFGGAFDVYITFDVCQAVPQGNVNFGTYGHFASILANKLIFGPLNVSLTTSLTYCSGVEVIAKSRDYIFESHYSFRWARDRFGGTVYAADIVYDIIEKWDNTLENVGIIFITENMVEDGLQSVVNKARALNITLMAVTLTSSGGPSQAMAEKAAIIDGSYVHMTYNDLYTLPGLVRIIMQRIPNLFRVPMQTVVGITLDDTLSLEQYASVDVFLQTLRKMITSVIKDKQYTESFQLELFNKLEVSRRANILRRIEYYTRVSLNKPDFIIIITNRPPLDTDLIAAAMNKSMESGVQVFMTGFTGALSQSVDTIASQIDKENKSVVILIDSSESVSKEDFFSAYKTSAALMWRLNNTVNVEVSTFDVNVNVEIPMTEYSITSRAGFVGKLYQMTHLMTKPPLYKAVEKMAEMAEINDIDDDDVRMVGVMFIADRPRYMNLLDLFKNYIYANRSTLIVVDVSLGGNIEGLEQDPLLFPMHIIRTRNLEFDTLPEQILEILNLTGYSKYHTVFTAGQISSIEGKFNLFENMLQAFRNAADNYNFNTDFGLITMENNALFDYFDLSMDEIIYILRRLMKVSDRGSETALDYSSGLFREHKMAETQQKQGVSLVVTDENPKFPNVVATKAAKARDEDGNHALVIGVGDTLDTSSLLSLNNVGDDSLCIASDGVDLRTNCVGWLVDRLKTLPTITPIQSSTTTTTEPTTTTTSSSTGLCNADAHVGIGVSSNLQVRDVFEILQENITQSIGDDVKFKFLVFYNSQLFQPNTEMKSSDPKAFQSVVEEVNARLTNLYTGQSNLVALLFTDAKSAADGISSDVLNVLSTYIDFVVFGIGKFSDSATADLKRLTKNMAHSLIIVDDVAGLDYDNSVAFLGKAVCDAVTKTPVVDIRTNITKICSIQPLDSSFDLDARNVQYPFDCTKLINCKRMGSSIRADVQSCPQNTRFNTDTHMCDIRQDVKCKEFTATEYALEIGKIIEPPIPKVVNVTEECINNCFKAGDLTDNYGYTYHPTDCSKFIVCRRQGYINPGYTFITRVENCPAGLFWNAQRKMCVPTHLAECAADMCKTKSMFALWNVNCRQFYKCDSGHSRLEHCAYGKKFQSGGYCVDDAEHTCKVTIVKPETCYNLPWTDSTMYIDRTIGDNGKLTSCPVGKMYDHQTCTCSRNYVTGTCQPLISETMDSTRTINNVWMRAGAATFMGLGMLTYTQPSPLTNTFLVHVVISVSKSNQDVVMLSSCQTPDTSAISLRLINDRLTAQVGMAGGTMTLTSKIQFDAWNHVYLAYNGQKIVLKTDSATDQVSASGTIQGCQNTYVLGSEYGFYGDVDELNVYDCIPEKYISIFN